MKKVIFKAVSGLMLLATVFIFIGAGNYLSVPLRAGSPQTSVVVTYANSQVDTLRFIREPGLAGLSFAIRAKDSMSLTSVRVRRVVNGVMLAPVAGDTIITTVVSITNDTLKIATVTLAPLCDEYRFFITYAGSANGVTTPTAEYVFNRQYQD